MTIIHYCGQQSFRRNGVAIIVNKRVQNAVLGCNLKNERMISIHFQGKSFNITVIQVYAPTNNAEEAEVARFYEDLRRMELDKSTRLTSDYSTKLQLSREYDTGTNTEIQINGTI